MTGHVDNNEIRPKVSEGMAAENGEAPSRDQLVTLVQSIMNVEGSEEEHHAKLEYLRATVSDPHVVDYIYWPPDLKEMSAEEVVERALSYKPIELRGTKTLPKITWLRFPGL
jgi:hypothetical protein